MFQDVISDTRWFANVLRQARRDADLSQRELARYAGVPKSVVGDIEAGVSSASFPVAERLLSACGYQVLVVNRRGDEVVELLDDDRRDRIGRRYPAHLDVRELSPVELTDRIRFELRPKPLSAHTYRLNRLMRDLDRWHGFYGEAAQFWQPADPDREYICSVLGYQPDYPLPPRPDPDDWLEPGLVTDLTPTAEHTEEVFRRRRQRPVKELLQLLEVRRPVRRSREGAGQEPERVPRG